MVLGGDDDVFHAGGFCKGDDVVRGEAGGIELAGEGLVVGDRDGEVVHDPLADVGGALALPFAGGDGIEAPVDEHAEAGVAPPCHAGVAPGGSFGVLNGGNGMIRGRGVGLAALELRVGKRRGEEEGGGDRALKRFHGESFV